MSVHEETKPLILSRTCLEQLGMVLGNTSGDGSVLQVEGQGKVFKASCRCLARSGILGTSTDHAGADQEF